MCTKVVSSSYNVVYGTTSKGKKKGSGLSWLISALRLDEIMRYVVVRKREDEMNMI